MEISSSDVAAFSSDSEMGWPSLDSVSQVKTKFKRYSWISSWSFARIEIDLSRTAAGGKSWLQMTSNKEGGRIVNLLNYAFPFELPIASSLSLIKSFQSGIGALSDLKEEKAFEFNKIGEAMFNKPVNPTI